MNAREPEAVHVTTTTPGDRFALQLAGSTITSWLRPGETGPRQRLVSTTVAPLLDLTDSSVRAQYHFAFGLRGDSGTMTATHFEGLGAP